MKKRNINKLSCIILALFLLFTFLSIRINAACSFTETSKTVRDLGYGVTVEEVHGTSKSNFLSYTSDDNRGQAIYTAMINKNSPAKIVQWTVFPTAGIENKWGVTTLSVIAKDYENKHPGKKVLVATNNWLSGTTSANTGELDGVQICDGLNYRVSDKQGDGAFSHDYIPRNFILGWDKSGNMIYDDDYNSDDYTDYLILSYYNGVGQDKTYLDLTVTKINSEPEDGEIAIYFSNVEEEIIEIKDATIVKMMGSIVRHDFASRSEFVERDAFAIGTMLDKVDKVDFSDKEDGVYYFVSKNDTFNNLDLKNKQLVCQYELLGDLKELVGATTYYYHIVRDGVMYNNNYDNNVEDAVEWSKGHQINNEVHPRTVYFQREDGTCGLSVIDGRRQAEGMTGMDYQDMAYFYGTYYNAYNVFNYDGGGSSAIVVANASGSFDCINNPSDGHQRGVANACLIVVDEQPFKINCDCDEMDKLVLKIDHVDSNVDKLFVKLNDKTYEAVSKKDYSEIEIIGLTKETTYTIECLWKNKQDETIYHGAILEFTTASQFSTLSSFDYFYDEEGTLKINLKVSDLENAFIKGSVTIDGITESFRDLEDSVEFYDLDPSIEHSVLVRIYSKVDIKNYMKESNFIINKIEAEIEEPIEPVKTGCNKGIDLNLCLLFIPTILIPFGFRALRQKKEEQE